MDREVTSLSDGTAVLQSVMGKAVGIRTNHSSTAQLKSKAAQNLLEQLKRLGLDILVAKKLGVNPVMAPLGSEKVQAA